MARLGDVCDVRDGTHDSPVYIDRGFPLVTSKNIIDGKLDLSVVNYISPEDYNKINERSNVECGDIIMPMIGTIGNPYIVRDFTDFAIKNVALIKFNNEQINNKYIYHFLNSENFSKYVAENNRGGTQKFLSLKDIRNLEVKVPSLKEQLLIVEKLDKLNKLILFRKQQLSKLDELVKARFVELFGDVNKAINTVNLESVCCGITDGSHNPPKGVDISKNYMISSQNIQDGAINYNDVRYLSDSDFNREDKRTNIRIGDVLLTIVGTVGRTAVVNDNINITSQRSVCIIHPNNDLINSVFLKYMLDNIYPQIVKEAHGIAQKGVYLKQVKLLQVILPNMNKQIEFADFVKQIDKSKFEVQQSLEKLETLKKSLMQQYFG